MSSDPQHLGDQAKTRAWGDYNFSELGAWVHLLTKRSEQRMTLEARAKDLQDARNYLGMMDRKLGEFEERAENGPRVEVDIVRTNEEEL
jgi:hypothetical protein